MTLFRFIQQCLRREAVRTEPDSRKVLARILQAPKEKKTPP